MILHQLKNSRGDIYLTISYDKELGCIMDVWTGAFETQENFRNGLELIVQELKHLKLSRWLADLRDMEGSWDFNRAWMVQELMPRARDAGLTHEAIVVPKEVFSKLSTVETIMMLEGYTIRQFDNLEEARKWLSNV